MFKKKTADQVLELLNDAIEDCFKEMKNLTADDDSYHKTREEAKELIKTRAEHLRSSKKISPESWLSFVATVGTPLVIFAYEQAGHVVSTKSLGFWKKPTM